MIRQIWLFQYWIYDHALFLYLLAIVILTIVILYLAQKDSCWIQVGDLNFRAIHSIWGLLVFFIDHSDAFLRLKKGDIFILDNLDEDD